ncbi:hypothetical protein ECOK1357_5171 [Escherichia coli OK1357]|nr:hypothetical protein ECOK1357_5171 [Escherichia coli OK1357]
MKNELNEQSWGRLKNMWQRAVTALRSQENKPCCCLRNWITAL